ncbi:MAG: hypothetical protein R2800_08330 [Flavipsychrobacter sp.]
MKKALLALALLCLIGIAAQAQVKSISVYNNTTHTLDIVLHGDPTGVCGTPYLSNIITMAPASSISFPDPSTVPGGMGGLTAADYFTAVQVTGSTACGTPSSIVYKCLGGTNFFVPTHSVAVNPPLCSLVTINNIMWTNLTPNSARVDIN